MRILAIETSCDDTSVALVEDKGGFKVLENIVSSQIKVHKKWGGVVPNLAKREHQKNLPLIINKIIRGSDPDFIAVTNGPGLEPCLWVGINFAIDLAERLKKPLIPVNHIESHLLANWAELGGKEVKFPALALIVSGGHTILILVKGIGRYEMVGETRDDAAGECFDKIAKILGLGYPGGPIVSQKASELKKRKYDIKLPRPMIYQKNYDFSFSGLKTAVLYEFQNRSLKIRKSKDYIREICFEAQEAITDVLLRKTIKAANDFKVNTIILGGGVVANKSLREKFKKAAEEAGLEIVLPSAEYCTDNAVMTAITAFFNRDKAGDWKDLSADANLKIGK
ncbi:MAG: tRNA (adenosine(37)-N6)-threonylcarbamoyltransferase complex transferase subunit TsaD [Candidatus Paceibacterota bacterium]|jgi:N6-L-threonylcarbamoyladenine synthase